MGAFYYRISKLVEFRKNAERASKSQRSSVLRIFDPSSRRSTSFHFCVFHSARLDRENAKMIQQVFLLLFWSLYLINYFPSFTVKNSDRAENRDFCHLHQCVFVALASFLFILALKFYGDLNARKVPNFPTNYDQ